MMINLSIMISFHVLGIAMQPDMAFSQTAGRKLKPSYIGRAYHCYGYLAWIP